VDFTIFVPEYQQVNARSFEFLYQRRPVGLGVEARPGTHAGVDE
jgi:hypothetical protein